MVISISNDTNVFKIALQLSKKMADESGYHFSIEKNATKASIYLELVSDTTSGNEGYRLSVTPERIKIWAHKPAGLFYGLQTFFQLLPKEIESKTVVKNIIWKIPSVEIIDKPRFVWRGLM